MTLTPTLYYRDSGPDIRRTGRKQFQTGKIPAPAPFVPTQAIVVEAVVGLLVTVTGTADPVTGITAGSSVIQCAGFEGKRVSVLRGNVPLQQIDAGDGTMFYTKVLASNQILLSAALVNGETLSIQTIP